MWSLMYNCALISTKINACKSKKFEKIFDTTRKLSIDLENWNDSKRYSQNAKFDQPNIICF